MTILRPIVIVLLALSPEPSQLTFQLAQCLVVSHCFPVSIRCSMLCQPAIGLLIIYKYYNILIVHYMYLQVFPTLYAIELLLCADPGCSGHPKVQG